MKIAIYDILGRLVINLVNGHFNAGHHKVQFNASSLASGIYFYRIEAGNFVNVKKTYASQVTRSKYRGKGTLSTVQSLP